MPFIGIWASFSLLFFFSAISLLFSASRHAAALIGDLHFLGFYFRRSGRRCLFLALSLFAVALSLFAVALLLLLLLAHIFSLSGLLPSVRF